MKLFLYFCTEKTNEMLMLRRFFAAVLLFMSAITIFAVPSKRLRRAFVLTDGSNVEATLIGNQDVSYYITDDGHIILKTHLGYELGEREPQGSLSFRKILEHLFYSSSC